MGRNMARAPIVIPMVTNVMELGVMASSMALDFIMLRVKSFPGKVSGRLDSD